MNRDNLDKLATHLEGLPKDYKHFDMSVYLDGQDYFSEQQYQECKLPLNECGTVACALGHGPDAGICFLPEERNNWYQYSQRFIDGDNDLWYWLFSDQWSVIDNTPHGAAARIRYVLAGKELPDWVPFRRTPDLSTRDLYAEYLK
jgi:hypothetical protein